MFDVPCARTLARVQVDPQADWNNSREEHREAGVFDVPPACTYDFAGTSGVYSTWLVLVILNQMCCHQSYTK